MSVGDATPNMCRLHGIKGFRNERLRLHFLTIDDLVCLQLLEDLLDLGENELNWHVLRRIRNVVDQLEALGFAFIPHKMRLMDLEIVHEQSRRPRANFIPKFFDEISELFFIHRFACALVMQ